MQTGRGAKVLRPGAVESSEPRASIRSATLLTVIIIVLGVVIASFSRGREPYLIAAILCGVMIATCWAVTLSLVVVIRLVPSLREHSDADGFEPARAGR